MYDVDNPLAHIDNENDTHKYKFKYKYSGPTCTGVNQCKSGGCVSDLSHDWWRRRKHHFYCTQTWGDYGEGDEDEGEDEEDGGEEMSFSLQLTWVSPVSTRMPASETKTERRILEKKNIIITLQLIFVINT